MPKRKFTDEELRNRIIRISVKDLKEFGWPSVSETNIITDEVYSMAFERSLNDAKGRSEQVDRVINAIVAEINTAKSKRNEPQKGARNGKNAH